MHIGRERIALVALISGEYVLESVEVEEPKFVLRGKA